MRLYAASAAAAVLAAGLSSTAFAEMISSDGVIYSYGTESVVSEAVPSVDYGYSDSVIIEESVAVDPSLYGGYQVSEEPVIVTDEPYTVSYGEPVYGEPVYGEAVYSDVQAVQVEYLEAAPSAEMTAEITDGVIYGAAVESFEPMPVTIQTY